MTSWAAGDIQFHQEARRRTLIVASIALVLTGSILAYLAWLARIEPMPDATMRIRDLSSRIGQRVTAKGIVGRRLEIPDPGARYYALTDDFGQTAVVRTLSDWPVTGVTYVVDGTVGNLPGRPDPILHEESRRLWRLEPAAGQGRFAAVIRWINSIEGGSTMGILAGLLLVGIGFFVAGFLYLRSISPGPAPVVNSMEPKRDRFPTPALWGRLRVISGPDQGRTIPLIGNKVSIGREADLRLSDETVSRQHAFIVRTNDGRIVYVDQSANGSIVNGKGLHMGQVEIANGAQIELGLSVVEFTQSYVGAVPAGEVRRSRRPTEQVDVAGLRPRTEAVGVQLVVVGGPDSGKRFPLRMDTTTIGRMEDRDIQLSDDAVSRHHASITNENGSFVIRDDGSSHGTVVNGERVTSKPLSGGETIMLGRTTLRFERG